MSKSTSFPLRNVSRWAVGITTAPRKQPTLPRCLNSLAQAGWSQPRLFAEPETEIPSHLSGVSVSQRDAVMGAFPNWYLGLTELFLREPRAEAYLMCQDDVVFSMGLREYLERTLWPAPSIGVVSIYCPRQYAADVPLGFYVVDHGGSARGALAYIFSNVSVRSLLADPIALNHRHHGPRDGLCQVDSVVGNWCQSASLPYYVHRPSLAQHIGDTSTLYAFAPNGPRRRAVDFVNSITDELSPLK